MNGKHATLTEIFNKSHPGKALFSLLELRLHFSRPSFTKTTMLLFKPFSNSCTVWQMTKDKFTKLFHQGVEFHEKGMLQRAEESYLNLIQLKPDDPGTNRLLGILYFNQKKFKPAADYLSVAVDLLPEQMEWKVELSSALLNDNQYSKAIEVIQSGLSIDPQHAKLKALLIQTHCQYARILYSRGEIFESAEHFHQALECDRSNPDLLNWYGAILLKKGDGRTALEILKQSENIRPGNIPNLKNLALTHQMLGEDSLAADYYQQILDIDEKYIDAWFARGLLSPDQFSDTNIITVKGLVDSKDIQTGAKAGFTLASVYEARKDIHNHFNYLKNANDLIFSQYRGEEDNTKQLFLDIINAYKPDLLSELSIQQDYSPVYVLGMPRSGTTLLEQIIAAHPDMDGLGENWFLNNTLKTFLAENRLDAINLPAGISNLDKSHLLSISNQLKELIIRNGNTAPRAVDKTINNFVFAGLEAILFPKAKFIHIIRNPVDTCFSCYKQLFATGEQTFSYDLSALRQTYENYSFLMNHWRTFLGDKLITISYEDLISDLESNVRKILQHCELEWNETCLNFAEQDSVIQTASMGQVKKGLYNTSIESWRPYEQYLKELLPLLDNY